MIRLLWRALVNGHPFDVCWWAAFTAWQAFAADLAMPRRAIIGAVYAVLFLLNLASWDYQRRHRAGGAP